MLIGMVQRIRHLFVLVSRRCLLNWKDNVVIRNSEAENLGFVQVETVTGGYVFKRTIPPAYGYSIEAFRDKYHLGSISVEGGSRANTVQNQLKSLKLKN